MKRYIALLRGINVGNKNRISMADLKETFEKHSFKQVKTYLNSGNVVFSSDESNIIELTKQIEEMINIEFNLCIPVFVILKNNLEDILNNAPNWWDNENKEIYDNLIFIMPPAKFLEVYDEIGKPNNKLEKIKNYNDVIFWSFKRKDYRKTNWWSKTANVNISNKLTIRTAKTIKKLVDL